MEVIQPPDCGTRASVAIRDDDDDDDDAAGGGGGGDDDEIAA